MDRRSLVRHRLGGESMSSAVAAVALVWVAVAGTAVVVTRDPLRQAFVAGFFGLALATLYLSLQSGDVALSQLVVGAIALPLIILLAIAKVRSGSR
jgi:energy-converting hydrogenase B subunit D